jgi:hypothetical protein
VILRLRQRHRWIFAVLCVLLPVALAVGILARRTVPSSTALSPELTSWTQTFTATEHQPENLFSNTPVRVSLWRDQESGRYAISFSAAKDFAKPDLLTYWIAGHPTITDTLPQDAALLGAFAGGPVRLPAAAVTNESTLILFSLADQEIVDVSRSTRLNDSTK